MIRSLRRPELLTPWRACGLALVLVLAQMLGLAHGVAHRGVLATAPATAPATVLAATTDAGSMDGRGAGSSAAHAPFGAAPAGGLAAQATGVAHDASHAHLFGHEVEALACQVYDLAAHADVAWGCALQAAVAAWPAAVPQVQAPVVWDGAVKRRPRARSPPGLTRLA